MTQKKPLKRLYLKPKAVRHLTVLGLQFSQSFVHPIMTKDQYLMELNAYKVDKEKIQRETVSVTSDKWSLKSKIDLSPIDLSHWM